MILVVDAPWFVPNTKRISKYQKLKKKSATTALNSARLSAHPNDLIVNLMELPDSNR
jgi:hypothetical protein